MHPLFQKGDTAINLSQHGTYFAEKLKKTWKDIIAEYDTVMVRDEIITAASNDNNISDDNIGSNNDLN
jgi:hypothetical protein